MESWILVRFSLKEIEGGVATRLLSDIMSLALQDLREVGVFSSELGFEGKCLYFSPHAAKEFASALAKLPAERCDPPCSESLLCLYGTAECLPSPGPHARCTTAAGPPLPTPPPARPDPRTEARENDTSDPTSGWSSVRGQIAKLLPEIAREESISHSPIGEDVDASSKTYLFLRAALVLSAATVIIALASPYLAWFAALVVW